ncbi:MAG: hypothetical protein U0X75_20805 [Acidobacteriota bacterium]
MSKAKQQRKQGRVTPQPDQSRRKLVTIGLGGLGVLAVGGIAGYKSGWFDSSDTGGTATGTSTTSAPAQIKALPPETLSADAANALRASDDMLRYYARELNNPSALIHAVRGQGKNFTLNDGSKAVDYLCSHYAADKEVNGKRYVFFPREHEVHDNSFLKTLLEAGVSADQTITVGSNKYTLRDLGDSAKALFRCDTTNFGRFDPTLIHQHLPWGLIAFSILTPPAQASWPNAYNETINLPQVIDKSLAVFESSCSGVRETILRGEMETMEFRQSITKYSCFGMHTVYGYFACLKNGYTNDKLSERLGEVLDALIYRLKGDAEAIDREADAAKGVGPDLLSRMAVEGQGGKIMTKGMPPPNTVELMRMRSQIRMLGHALEAINFAQLHKLFTVNAAQKKRLQAGEQMLYEYLVKLRTIDLQPFLNWYPKFVSDIVIALGHASRAMKLLTPNNPDTVA